MSEGKECADELQNILKLLKDKEVFVVTKLMLTEMVERKYSVLGGGIEIFFKELIARIVYYDEKENQDYLFNVVEILDEDEWQKKFCDKYGNKILECFISAVNSLKRNA